MLKKKAVAAAIGLTVAAGAIIIATSSGAFAAPEPGAAPAPPKGARATVQVDPNPVWRGQEVTITGDCGGGTGLKAVLSGFSETKPVLEDVRIIDPNPAGFLAKARLSDTVGNGVGPVFVDCGGEAGVTLIVTHA
ncbi:hypothetical protein [Saccharopolyspora elongata]|uniref:hypothetical protein n=1 Tax=Saccharopolyspora elongata TaxID=2530387 RepID=UPI001A9CC093|nr:hypothetical protein [Saccharopolyspora elongata]